MKEQENEDSIEMTVLHEIKFRMEKMADADKYIVCFAPWQEPCFYLLQAKFLTDRISVFEYKMYWPERYNPGLTKHAYEKTGKELPETTTPLQLRVAVWRPLAVTIFEQFLPERMWLD